MRRRSIHTDGGRGETGSLVGSMVRVHAQVLCGSAGGADGTLVSKFQVSVRVPLSQRYDERISV